MLDEVEGGATRVGENVVNLILVSRVDGWVLAQVRAGSSFPGFEAGTVLRIAFERLNIAVPLAA